MNTNVDTALEALKKLCDEISAHLRIENAIFELVGNADGKGIVDAVAELVDQLAALRTAALRLVNGSRRSNLGDDSIRFIETEDWDALRTALAESAGDVAVSSESHSEARQSASPAPSPSRPVEARSTAEQRRIVFYADLPRDGHGQRAGQAVVNELTALEARQRRLVEALRPFSICFGEEDGESVLCTDHLSDEDYESAAALLAEIDDKDTTEKVQ